MRERITSELKAHAPRANSALVVGCGASALVGDLAEAVETSVGIDTALPSLLLARRLLDGETFTCHLERANWSATTLTGSSTPRACDLIAADALALPFQDASFDAVVTQYLLDVIVDPTLLLSELNRVLVDGGIWINDGLPFRLRGEGALLGTVRSNDYASAIGPHGFTTVSVERRSHTFLDLREEDPWSPHVVHQVIHAVAKKSSRSLVSPERGAITSYFAGDSSVLLPLKPSLHTDTQLSIARRIGNDGRELEPTIRLGDIEIRMTDEPSSTDLITFLRSLDGSRSVEEIVGTAVRARVASSERDAVLALDALLRAGVLRIAGTLSPQRLPS